MDVSVIICDKFQQVFVEYVEVPQLPFIDRVVVQLLHRDRYTVQSVLKTGDSPGAVLDRLGRPSLCNDRLDGADSAEKCGRTASAVL